MFGSLSNVEISCSCSHTQLKPANRRTWVFVPMFTVFCGPSGSGKTTLLNHVGLLDLPSEGELASQPTAGSCAHDDVVTCALDEPVGSVRTRIEESPYGFAVVVSEGGVVLGRLRRRLFGSRTAMLSTLSRSRKSATKFVMKSETTHSPFQSL